MLNLTDDEKHAISDAASDLWSGNHLLRKRSELQKSIMNELCTADAKFCRGEELTEREKALAAYYCNCDNPPRAIFIYATPEAFMVKD